MCASFNVLSLQVLYRWTNFSVPTHLFPIFGIAMTFLVFAEVPTFLFLVGGDNCHKFSIFTS